MTTWTERIPVDEITEQAQEAKPGRVLLTVAAGVLFGVGWITARIFAVLFLAASWSFVAIREGWRASHGPSRASRLETVTAERDRWREEARRLGG